MTDLLKRIAFKLGIDKSILFTSLARIIQAIGGIISIIFVARYLTATEQGFYYTFGSIVAIQVFFELGLNSIITQYVAHETSHLQWKNPQTLIGEQKYLSRLSSLLHFSVKWYSCFALILLVTLATVGFMFFTKYQVSSENIVWKLPWILLAITTSMNLLITPVLAFFEGIGKVIEIAKIRFFQQLIGFMVICIGLFYGAKLFVNSLCLLFGITIVVVLLYNSTLKYVIIKIWKIDIIEKVDYKKEIFPYQWKIALSWISGYFIFQLFSPVLFATDGAVVAGQMGMTLAALNGVKSLSMSWMTTKIPLYSSLIAKKKFFELDMIFNKAVRQSAFIIGILLLLVFVIIQIVGTYHIMIENIDLSNRFLSSIPLLFMVLSCFMSHFTSSWAIYLRCHKREPFLINSIVGGGLCCLSTILFGNYFGLIGVTSGYFIIITILFFWGYKIFKTKKNEWHE